VNRWRLKWDILHLWWQFKIPSKDKKPVPSLVLSSEHLDCLLVCGRTSALKAVALCYIESKQDSLGKSWCLVYTLILITLTYIRSICCWPTFGFIVTQIQLFEWKRFKRECLYSLFRQRCRFWKTAFQNFQETAENRISGKSWQRKTFSHTGIIVHWSKNNSLWNRGGGFRT